MKCNSTNTFFAFNARIAKPVAEAGYWTFVECFPLNANGGLIDGIPSALVLKIGTEQFKTASDKFKEEHGADVFKNIVRLVHDEASKIRFIGIMDETGNVVHCFAFTHGIYRFIEESTDPVEIAELMHPNVVNWVEL